jgi:catechol 2,3-dioxygenase-like lactoylglutathione lyase family enzyme
MPAPLPIRALHHIARVTRVPEASRAFYCDVLGFRELPRPDFDFRGAWLYNYGVQIHIIENPELASPSPHPEIDTRANHVAFAVDDMRPVKQSLEEHGIVYRENINAGGIHQIFFQDPDGHHIEIAAHSDPSVGYVKGNS